MCKPQTLDDYITLSGKKKSYLAEVLGMSVQTFRLKRLNPKRFKAAEMVVLCQEIGITDIEVAGQIFLFKK